MVTVSALNGLVSIEAVYAGCKNIITLYHYSVEGPSSMLNVLSKRYRQIVQQSSKRMLKQMLTPRVFPLKMLA